MRSLIYNDTNSLRISRNSEDFAYRLLDVVNHGTQRCDHGYFASESLENIEEMFRELVNHGIYKECLSTYIFCW